MNNVEFADFCHLWENDTKTVFENALAHVVGLNAETVYNTALSMYGAWGVPYMFEDMETAEKVKMKSHFLQTLFNYLSNTSPALKMAFDKLKDSNVLNVSIQNAEVWTGDDTTTNDSTTENTASGQDKTNTSDSTTATDSGTDTTTNTTEFNAVNTISSSLADKTTNATAHGKQTTTGGTGENKTTYGRKDTAIIDGLLTVTYNHTITRDVMTGEKRADLIREILDFKNVYFDLFRGLQMLFIYNWEY